MKRFNLMFSLIVLVVVLTFTSCLKDDGETQPVTLFGILTVQEGSLGRFVLKDSSGRLYNVTQNSSGKDLSLMGRAIVVFNYVNESDLTDTSKKSFDIKVVDAVSIVDKVLVTNRGSAGDSLKSRCYFPVLDIAKGQSADGSVIGSDGYMTLGIDYLLSGSVLQEFLLFRYREDGLKAASAGPDTLDLYLGHNTKGDKGNMQLLKYISAYNVANWPLYFHAFQVKGLVPGGYSKDTLVMRVNYRKDTYTVQQRDTVDAFRLVKYPTK